MKLGIHRGALVSLKWPYDWTLMESDYSVNLYTVHDAKLLATILHYTTLASQIRCKAKEDTQNMTFFIFIVLMLKCSLLYILYI